MERLFSTAYTDIDQSVIGKYSWLKDDGNASKYKKVKQA